jgi:D-sedoheptulose 7-phosphate isomerase
MIGASELVDHGYEERARVVREFFRTEAARLAELCHEMARRFARGGRLVAFGTGPAATDAQHVSVEFVHPVIVGKRALPALALPNDAGTSLGLAEREGEAFIARQVEMMMGPEDIALGITHGAGGSSRAVALGVDKARANGMLAVSLQGASGSIEHDRAFGVPSDDPFVVQEVHETLYHVLWELVHVFFEHKGLLDDRPRGKSYDAGSSSFLYPFLAEREADLDGLLHDVQNSILQKAADVTALRSASRDARSLERTAGLIRERVDNGGRILAFGNGGSATDAQDLVVDLLVPPAGYRPIPALSLTNDASVLTAIGNDVGFENVFARQVIAYAGDNDVVVAISTSGGSRNVLAAVDEARRRRLLTVALAGYGGGRLAQVCDCAHTVDADYIPRIQEAQATQYHLLRSLLRQP